jgi:rhodanese-related sulfurtransferase
MKYEIPREMFKQRLEERLNFVLVDLVPADKTPVKFENVVHINYSSNFKNEFATQYPNKNQNVVVYSLNKGDESPAQAAEDLKALGYNFVYFYNGTPDDAVLDKGLN